MTSKGKPVANADQWKELHSIAENHLLLPEPGRHAYTSWMLGKMKEK